MTELLPPEATPLDPLTLPLRGSHLIEASAGTGKTFTIALLYVRLVLAHGGEVAGPGRPLTPPDILVVTFTEAATQELRDRIRARLAQAAAFFRCNPDEVTQPSHPDPLHALRSEYPPGEWSACARKLEVAAEWMDEAAISTIHGWCNRMLHEHAFDSLSLFDQTLETDASELLSDVVRDYWRRFYYPLSVTDAALIAGHWQDPTQLEQAVRPLLECVDRLDEADPPQAVLERVDRAREQALRDLKAPWPAWVAELTQLLEEARAQGRVQGQLLRPAHYRQWLSAVHTWATTDKATLNLSEAAWKRLTPTGIAEAWKDGPALDHPALHELSRVRDAQARLPQPKSGLLSHAARWIAAEFKTAQHRRSQLGFDDLLIHVETALNGAHGERLAEVIRAQFPVALIDEFQDTDPIQYRIFDRIYALASHRQDCALILIGDPKQAIYGFRGADIHTYLKARQAAGHRLYSLGTNHRSTQALVEATNHCFQWVEQRPSSAGAFLFRQGGHNPVPFMPVQAAGLKTWFEVQGATATSMVLHLIRGAGKLSKEAYVASMADICATQLVDWLNLGQAGQAGFAQPGQPLRPLSPGDIAILVNNRTEAQSMRLALARRGVRSVYLSEKDTVFDTPQATEVYRWLLACAEPDNERWIKAALSTSSLGLDFSALEALHQDDLAWDARIVQFKGYQDVWRKQGVLPMIRRILVDFHCADRLLPLASDLFGQSGERILTDLLHLAELLQQASLVLEGEQALIRYLAEQIAQPSGSAEDQRLRLESDADLVQVITIHKSKGLEYPLVMLPFLCATRPVKLQDLPVTWHDQHGVKHVSLEVDESIRARADAERLGEDVRKLYVALTRARYLTWIGMAYLDTHASSALAHLLGLQDATPESWVSTVHDWARDQPHIRVVDTHAVHTLRYQGASTSRQRGLACRPVRPARESWWISSYSHLALGGERRASSWDVDDTAQTSNWWEGQQEITSGDWPSSASEAAFTRPMHRFPRGAQPGTFLHDVLEWCANTGFPTAVRSPELLREHIHQRCAAHRWESWAESLQSWVHQVMTTPLPLGDTAIELGTLTTTRAEMEFWIEARHLDLQALDQAVIQHTLGGRPRPGLTAESLNGMLKGFMDLVLEHEGRYYVLDYKSNWLGPDDDAYTAHSLDQAIRAHRYDLQYVLYLFALHRLLCARLPDYDYDVHVGGALYLFLRGIASPCAGVHFERPPKALILLLDRLFAGQVGEVG